MSAKLVWSTALSTTEKSLGTMRRPLTSMERLSSISRTRRRPSSMGRIEPRERRNTPSTIRSKRCSNDCNPIGVRARLLPGRDTGPSSAGPIAADRTDEIPVHLSHANLIARPAMRFASTCRTGISSLDGLQRACDGLAAALAFGSPLARVAEWQTRWLQVPVRETSWGFKSPLAHDGSRMPGSEPAPIRCGVAYR
jgi:hypothetical protein